MARTATALTSWCRAIKSALDEQGADSAALFERAGLDVAQLQDPNARYPVENTILLWRLASEATGDTAFGLSVSRHIRQTTFHALGYSLLASATLEKAFERLIRYFRIVTDAYELEFKREGEYFVSVIAVDADSPRPTDDAIDAFMAVQLRMCRALYGEGFKARAIELERPATEVPERYERVLRGPVQFGAGRNALLIDSSIAQASLESSNPELARMNDEVVVRYLTRMSETRIVDRVHALLVEQLPQGDPGQESIARLLHMSLRSLQRRLSEENTSYKTLLDETRRDLALSYMKDDHYSVSEVAYLVGFFDSSSFSRSFKRWTGLSPSAWRERGSAT